MNKRLSLCFIGALILMLSFTMPNMKAASILDEVRESYATYTGSGYSGGAALLDPIPSDMKITALNPHDYNYKGVNAALAGAYLEVTGPKGKTVVYVTDKYPEGAKGALDLSPNAFTKIGNMEDGKIPISWKIIKAPISGNVAYRIKEGSSEWWAAIQVRNHKYPVMKMEYYKDGKWVNMEKTDYNHFLGFHMGSTSLPVRITDIRGVIVKDQLPALPSTAASQAYIVKGNVQLPN